MSQLSSSVSLEVRDGIAVLLVDNPPVNALSQHVRVGLQLGVRQVAADSAIKAAVIACKGRTFIAGADITEFGKPPQAPGLQEVHAEMEACPKPLVAAIHGTALGGGLETALVCHARVALASAKCGLPEVKLGILPGSGGTQRLPRVVGVKKALEMIVSGNPIGAAEAHEVGLVDEVVAEGGGDPVAALLEAAVAFARRFVAEGRALQRIRDREEKLDEARRDPSIFDSFRRSIARKSRGFEAAELNIQAIEAAAQLPFDEGMKKERELFIRLMEGEQSKAQRYYFFAEREAAKVPGIAKDVARREIKKVGVLGAGTMGGGIAMNFVNIGIPVAIVERDQAALDRGLGVVRKNYERTAKSGRITGGEVEQRMERLTGSTELDALADCDLVIEAVFENMDLKREIFGRFDQIIKQGAILATNTSALDVNVIAASTQRPSDVIGLHFFSPANVMRLLEVVRGKETADDVLQTCLDVSRKIGKIAVVVGVCPGFVGNRILYQRRLEANALILEGATPWQVDQVIYDFGFPMGPFAMADLAGNDIGWNKDESAGRTVREVLCERGRLGQKAGKGYYVYDPDTRASAPDPEVEQIIEELSRKQGIVRREITDQEILERCLYPMVNEGAKILDEGIAIRASDIDVVWVNGYGWPVYRGGPMFWADGVGLPSVLEKIREYSEKVGGDQWRPSPYLERLVAEGKTFTGR